MINNSKVNIDMDNIDEKGSEINYSPKTYSMREQIVSAFKFLFVFGIVVFIFWLMEKFVSH